MHVFGFFLYLRLNTLVWTPVTTLKKGNKNYLWSFGKDGKSTPLQLLKQYTKAKASLSTKLQDLSSKHAEETINIPPSVIESDD